MKSRVENREVENREIENRKIVAKNQWNQKFVPWKDQQNW